MRGVARCSRSIRALLVLGSLLLGLACDQPTWRLRAATGPLDTEVAVALGDTAQQSSDLRVEDVPVLAYPRSLRPCCAFGANLKVEVGRFAVPGVELGNLVDPKGVGPHHYDNGYVSINARDPRGWVDTENNGLVYTCRGGFVDLAHVRDNADNTLALAFAVGRMLETGGTLAVPSQGAELRIHLRPISEDAIERLSRGEIAIALARWIAYQLSIWHEIATYYGYASIAEWPEKISAFSPEDLYSNEIGARLSAGLMRSGGAKSHTDYDLGMDTWIEHMLLRLGAVPLAGSEAAASAVDGTWFDSQRRIPDWKLVMRRNFDTGPVLRPWRIEMATGGAVGAVNGAANGAVAPLPACQNAGPPLELHVEEGFAGALFQDYATLEADVGDVLAGQGFPFPREGDRKVTQKDFPFIVEATRVRTVAEMGAGSDAP